MRIGWHWIVLVLLLGLLGGIYSLTVTKLNETVIEVEALPSSFQGEIDYFDPLAENSYARFVHDETPSDGGEVVFYSPQMQLEPGDYQASFAVRALAVPSGAESLQVEVTRTDGGELLASKAIDVQQLDTEAYDEIAVDFSVDFNTSGVDLRASYPGRGAYWFDAVRVRKLTPWNLPHIYWPSLTGLLLAALIVNWWRVESEVSFDTALRNPIIERSLVKFGNAVLLGLWLFSTISKYTFDVERIVYAYVADDAFYYFETAANLAQRGMMSFDGITFSNGFHPLWVFLLVPVYWLGLNPETTLLIGLLLADVIIVIAVLLLFWVLRRRFNVFLSFALTLLFYSQVQYLVQYGLESAVLIGSFVALLAFYDTRFPEGLSSVSFRNCGLLALLLGVVVLARLDHGIFVAVFLVLFIVFNWRSLLIAQERRKLATILGITAVIVLPYLIFSYTTTGHVVPISGVLKGVWSQKRLADAMRLNTYFQAKADNFVMVLSVFKDFFWSMVGSFLIFWVLLARRSFAPYKMLLPFVFGPMLIFGYYIFFYHYPFNSFDWYYLTIWLAGLLTIGLAIDFILEKFRISENPLFQGVLIGVVGVFVVIQVIAQINRQWSFFQWVRTQNFGNTYKFLSWRAADHIQDHVWSSGGDGEVVFASADSGVLGFVLEQPVVNLDGLINNEILEYELQDEHWYMYAIDKSEIDYVVNVFKEEWLPPPLFDQHFTPCYISKDLNRDDLGFRIYGRKAVLQGDERDFFTAGCVVGQLSSWWAGETPSGSDPVPQNDGNERSEKTRCAMPSESNRSTPLASRTYVNLPAGTYEVDYFLSVNDRSSATAVARLDVSHPVDGVIAERVLTGEDFKTLEAFQRFTVPFRLTNGTDDIKFRVFHTGEQVLCIQGIRLLECEEGCVAP